MSKQDFLGLIGEGTNRWLGMDASYGAKHAWLVRHHGKPERCADCGIQGKDTGSIRKVWNIQWANISGKYFRDISDYRPLCISCHRKYDAKDRCKQGHLRSKENTSFRRIDGQRFCKLCNRRYQRNYEIRKKNGKTS